MWVSLRTAKTPARLLREDERGQIRRTLNKPVTIICGAMAGAGLALLGTYFYYAVAYGNFEAGNYHRCRYWSERDAATDKLVKRWERNWELTESPEGSPFYHTVYDIDVWLISTGLLFLSAGIWVGEWSVRHKRAAY